MSDERVRLLITDGIADVRLNRPDKRNALDLAMFAAIAETIDQLAAIEDLKAVVLSGTGSAFCAGIDLGDLERIAAIDLEPRSHGPANLFQHCAWGWHILPVPVIAAVTGEAFGGGLQIALGADIRIVAPDARLSVMEARWGLAPDMAGTLLLPGLLRDDLIRELTYSARIVDGHEALAAGLATRLGEDPHREALSLARMFAAQNPAAIRAAKRLLAFDPAEAERRLLAESVAQQALLASPALRDRLASRPG